MSVMDTHVSELEDILRSADDPQLDVQALENTLKDAEEVLEAMKIELHSVTNSGKKAEYTMKIRQFTTKIDQCRKKVLVTNSSGQVPASGRAAAESATAQNQRSLEILKKAHQQLAEAENDGQNVIENLAKQKEQLNRIKSNTEKVNDDLSYSNKLLTRMGKWWRG